MIGRRRGTKDPFWFGFVVGAVVGGIMGGLLVSELGKRAVEHLETALQGARGRFNGHSGLDKMAVDLPEETEADSA